MMVTFPVFLFFILMGMPIVFCLGVAAALTLHLTTATPLVVLPQRLYSGLDSYTLLAIPFFIAAGLVMEMGGIAKRIIEFAASLVGWITGGLLMVAIIAGAGLASISGSGSADTAAIASVMTPEMRRRRYNIDFAAGIMACAGALGPIIPPSIIMVVIATVSGLSVGRMFLGGVVPGLLMGMALLLASYLHARRNPGVYRDAEAFSAARVGRAFLAAVPALLMPVIIVGGIVGGVFTPTEAAAVVLFYGLVVGLFVYRELTFAMLPRLFLRAACTTAAVMLIIGTAAIFSWLIAVQDVPGTLSRFLKATADSPFLFLLFVNILLLAVGMFMESIAAVLILVPVLMPIAVGFGIDPIHFGVLIAVNLSVGLATPPYGICLFVACSVTGRRVMQVARHLGLPLAAMVTVQFLITYVPDLVLFLPRLFLS
ncbi:hypothetical protein STVA_11620 [Allostella vacuolata]|nr:hypothetical protein STVA_11620 [Stella vacuolata]